MKNSNKKGFTLIELLVVIAIIGILSSVVLASLTTARSKGQVAAEQAQLSNMRAQAELYYSNNSNAYSTATMGSAATWSNASTSGSTDTASTAKLVGSGTGALGTLLAGVTSTYSTAFPQFLVTPTTWVISATLPGGGSWCVDSTGKSASSTISGLACL